MSPLTSNLLYCNISVHDIQYEFIGMSTVADTANQGTFRTISYVASSMHTTKLLAAMLDSTIPANQAAFRSDGAGLRQGATFQDSYAQELSRAMIGATAAMFEGSQAQIVSQVSTTLGSKVQLLPLALMLTTSFAYWYARSPPLL